MFVIFFCISLHTFSGFEGYSHLFRQLMFSYEWLALVVQLSISINKLSGITSVASHWRVTGLDSLKFWGIHSGEGRRFYLKIKCLLAHDNFQSAQWLTLLYVSDNWYFFCKSLKICVTSYAAFLIRKIIWDFFLQLWSEKKLQTGDHSSVGPCHHQHFFNQQSIVYP